MTQSVDNKRFLNPSVGVELTVEFSKTSTDIDTATTKYMNLPAGTRKVQIRSNKIFKLTKVNGDLLSDPAPSSDDDPEFIIDMSGTGCTLTSVAFEPEEASGDFNVFVIAGADRGSL